MPAKSSSNKTGSKTLDGTVTKPASKRAAPAKLSLKTLAPTATSKTVKTTKAAAKNAAREKTASKKPASAPPGRAGNESAGGNKVTRSGGNPLDPARVTAILDGLAAMYPKAICALTHSNAWELLVATILSAQCTDVRVNMVTPIIFKKYPTPADFARIEPEQLEPDIRSTGFFRNKAKSVVGAARKIVAEFGGQVPADMEQLLTVPGAARKTANVVLGSWFRKAEGVVVDTHVHRISRRLELTRNDDPKSIERDLMQVLPRDQWIDFSHRIIWHGRALCIARKPKCAECQLEPLCHAEDKTWTTVETHKGAK
jgi:endonuclease-3